MGVAWVQFQLNGGQRKVCYFYSSKSIPPGVGLKVAIMTKSSGKLLNQICVFFLSCRATRWPFWLGFITPFLLLYVFDWIMFSVITASLLKRRCTRSKATSDSRSKLYRENFIIAVSLATVFGLGWGFGLLVTSYPVDEVTYTFQVLFSIFVGAQGPLLFILHGIRNADARAVWKDWATSFSSSATRLRSMASSSIHKSLTTAQSSVNAPLSSSSTGPHTLPEAGQLFDPQAEAVLSQHTSLEMLSKETMADR